MCLRKEESGVAFLMTIAVSGFLFALAAFSYAVGEDVRRKVELQSATDAAAYSASVVQADALSRIALINKAMSWTYIQMSRRQMDYAVHVWLKKVVPMFLADKAWVETINWSGTCPGCHKIVNVNYQCGYGTHGNVRLNSKTENIYTVSNALKSDAWGTQQHDYILRDERAIAAFNSAIPKIMGNANHAIKNAAETTFYENVSNASCSVTSNDFNKFLSRFNDERQFLSFSRNGEDCTAKQLFSSGTDNWFVLNRNVDGIQRIYTQTSALRAIWYKMTEKWNRVQIAYVWVCVRNYFFPRTRITVDGSEVVENNKVIVGDYICRPWKLDSNFFDKDGAIVVKANCEYTNPFDIIWGNVTGGFYSLFNLDGRRYKAVAASRAACNVTQQEGNPYYQYWMGDKCNGNYWNLCATDWDGMLLPVNLAWKYASGTFNSGKFSNSGENPLN